MKVTAILKGKTDDHGRQTIYIRTNQGEKRTYKATKLKVTEKQFKDGVVVNHPKSKLYNDLIKEKINEVEYHKYKGERKYPDADFRTYVNHCLKLWNLEKGKSVKQQTKYYTEQFLELYGEMNLSRVTVDLLNRYKAWLNDYYKGSNTVWKALTRMRTIFTRAIQEKILQDDPFDLFDIPPFRQTKRNYLTDKQLERIEDYALSKDCPDALKLYAVWFVISCYTGLRFSDMQQFNKKKHIKGGRLILHTIKTGDIVSIPFNEKLAMLFDEIDYSPLNSNQKTNKNLKYLMDACDIDLNLTVHVARHTFAVRCATAGIPIEVTGKLLAQTSTKTTSIYYKITNPKIDQEFGKLF